MVGCDNRREEVDTPTTSPENTVVWTLRDPRSVTTTRVAPGSSPAGRGMGGTV